MSNTLKNRLPKYRYHKGSGQAVVTINGKDRYLGQHNSPASRREYDRLVAEWLASGRAAPLMAGQDVDLSVNELLAAYLRHAHRYYRKDGQPSSEIHCLKLAFRPLRLLYGRSKANAFGPLALKAVREKMQADNLSRSGINARVSRIKRLFRWGAENELISATVFHGVQSVTALRRGRTDAKETDPVTSVEDWVVEETIKHLPKLVADMVRLQRLTGARPGEICAMTPAQVDTSSDVWEFSPTRHKTQHHGQGRTVFIGPKAQAVLKSYLTCEMDSHCFSPRLSEKLRNEERRQQRQTPLYPSHIRRMRHQRQQCRCACEPGTKERRTVTSVVAESTSSHGRDANSSTRGLGSGAGGARTLACRYHADLRRAR
jgi:integrase